MTPPTNPAAQAVPGQKADTPTPRTTAVQLKELAFTVLHDVYHLGEDLGSIDLDQLAERIGRVHAGMNPQNEFHAMVSWLGQCTTINAIQDAGTGEREPALRAPDYLLVSKVDGRAIPVLVEVKATNDDELVWSDKYLASLRRFAKLLSLPSSSRGSTTGSGRSSTPHTSNSDRPPATSRSSAPCKRT